MLPDHGFIGAEPFLNGVATALGHIRDKHLANVRLWRGDALDVLQRVPDGALSFLYLLHPDPWPKARHAKRRMVNDRPVDLFAAKLKARRRVPPRDRRPDLSHLVADGDAAPLGAVRMACRNARSDFLDPPGGWIETRYGAKSRREGPPALLFALSPDLTQKRGDGNRPQDPARRRRFAASPPRPIAAPRQRPTTGNGSRANMT